MTKAKPRTSPYFLIVNPTSGSQKLGKTWDSAVSPFLKSHLGNFSYKFTKKKGDATLLTREALKKGFETIVCLGGDGTLNEVVNGFFNLRHQIINPKAKLGILPFGSGGDFLKTLGIEKNYKQAVRHLKQKRTFSCNVGIIDTFTPQKKRHYFINIANAGVVGNIMKFVNRQNRNLPSLYRYLKGTVLGFRSFSNEDVCLKWGKKESSFSLTNVVVGNGQYFGNGMHPLPNAKLNDDLLDILIFHDANLLRFLKKLPRVFAGNIPPQSEIHKTFRTKSIEITPQTPENIVIEMDGEVIGTGRAKISLDSNKIPILLTPTKSVINHR